MNLLFVHEVNWWTKVVYEIHELPELLSQRGHAVTLIDFPEGVARTGLRRLLDFKTSVVRNAHRAYSDGAIEVRTPGRVFPAPFDRLFATLTFSPLLRRTIKEKRPDAIILYGVPTNGWQTIRIARRHGIPVVFRALDVSHALRKSVFTRLIKRAERFIYKNANFISANNEALAEYCISQGAPGDRIDVHYPGMDLELLIPRTRDMTLAESLGIESTDRVVMFMGTLYRFAGLDTFLELMAPALHVSADIKILLLGEGEYFGFLNDKARQLEISDQVIFTGFVDYQELTKYMTIADVAVNPFPPTLVTNCALPSKVLQYLCCGIPTVATPVDGLAGLIPDGNGVDYRKLDESFAEAVLDLLSNPERRSMLSVQARRIAEDQLRWKSNIKRFEDVLRSLVSPPSA